MKPITFSFTNGAGELISPSGDLSDATLHLTGTTGEDFLVGAMTMKNDIHGLTAADWIFGKALDDSLYGGKGDDVIWGDKGNDIIDGNTGNDVIFGSVGDDVARGNAGNDIVNGGKGNDIVAGGQGDDVVRGNSGDDVVLGGQGDDQLYATSGNDKLDGGAGNDVVDAGSGDDVVKVSTGNDIMRGGSGFDTLDFSGIVGKVDIDLGKHTASFAAGKQSFADTVSGFERIVGSDAGNHMKGDHTDNEFVGGKSADWFRGNGGTDVFTGGDGADTFVWLKKDTAVGGTDTITDFKAGEDHLDMSDFLKGHAGYDDVVRIGEDARGNAVVQGLVNKAWVDVVTLAGVNAHDVGADHHQMSVHDLGLLA